MIQKGETRPLHASAAMPMKPALIVTTDQKGAPSISRRMPGIGKTWSRKTMPVSRKQTSEIGHRCLAHRPSPATRLGKTAMRTNPL